jgi:Tol biopolymer transport system component
MPLSVGDKLGHYEVISLLGLGGMGEIYKARDTTLKRDVALKVLPASFLRDSERMARFQREAEVLASLDHPNVGPIYGIADSEDSRGLVLALIEGPTLADQIALGPLPLDDALSIAKQIIEALEYAHDRGVVHRDLKPANIKITPEGVVKVLDFGLAKVLEDEPPKSSLANSPTMTLGHTRAGVILGTAAYMSPEQAIGRPVDRRSDIFSFGAVLYEMLTSKRAFGGTTTPDVLEAVVKSDPDWSALPSGTPGYLRRLLERTLAKDRKQRLQAIGEARIVLAKPQSDEPWVVPVSAPSPLRLRWLWPGVAALAITGALGLSFVHFREAPPVTPLVQTDMPLPEGVVPGYGSMSPDGTKLVVRGTPPGGRPQLYLRLLGTRAFAPVPGTENVAVQPFWSPDSQWIAFGAGGKLLKWNVTGGQPPQIVCNADVNYGSWGDDGVILFSEDGKPIQRVPAVGGTPRNALELDSAFGEQSHNGPSFLPGGKAFLFTSNGKIRGATFFATLDGKVRHHLFDNTYGLNVYVANPSGDGFLAYTERSQLLARPFNPATGEFLGEAVLLVDGVVNGPTFSFGGPGYLAYTPTRTVSTQLRYYGGDGKPGETLGEPGELASPQLSPDGKRVMFGKRNSGKSEIWVSGETGASEPIAGDTVPLVAIWTPDGRILYSRREAQENVVIERPADALGAESILARIPGNAGTIVRNISANGKVVALSAAGGGRNETSLLSRPGGNARPANISQVLAASGLALSPDGRWLTYVVGPSPFHIFVRAIPEDPAPLPPGEREIASIATRIEGLRWSADGKEILFLTGPTTEQRAMMSLPIVWNDGTPRAGAIRKLFDAPRALSFDVTTTSRRFIVAESLSENTISPIVLVQNWSALLRK